MFNANDPKLIALHQQDQMQQADHVRLVQTAREARKEQGSQTVYGPLLAKVGDVMVSVGQQLQERYSTLQEAAAQPYSTDKRSTAEMPTVS